MRLVDVDRLKDILEYGILCNVPANAVNTEEEKLNDWVKEVVDKAPTVEAIPKADYENRLKAEKVAMLEDLKQDLIAEAYGIEMFGDDLAVDVPDIEKVIQQKINLLKEPSNDD